MKVSFRDKISLSKNNIIQLEKINNIINEYVEQGYRLTLRQLYYQLVSRDIIPNNVKEYAKISGILVKGRMAGIVDWDAIVDRIRTPQIPYYVSGTSEAIQDTISQYRLDRQKDQDIYIEVWVEKDALSEILKRVTSYYHIRLMVNRGYSSVTAMHDAAMRFKKSDKESMILYLGDHDPSGLDMIRDISDRLSEFDVYPKIKPIALTMMQIKKYNPPSNPAKITDSRAKDYISKFGPVSWEVDALSPKILHDLITMNIESIIDIDLFKRCLEIEEKDKIWLESIMGETEESD